MDRNPDDASSGRTPASEPNGGLRLSRDRIYILPTRHGILFAIVLFVMLAGAMNYENSLGFALTFLLVSVAVVSILHTYQNMVGLTLYEGKTSPTYCGDPSNYELLVRNAGRHPRYGLAFECGSYETQLRHIAGPDVKRVCIKKTTHARGRQQLGRVKISTRYPLGLFRAWVHLDVPFTCVVYPKPGPRTLESAEPAYRPTQLGDRGRGTDDFMGFRPYHAGDSPRHVYWKAFAREQGLLTKQFGGDRVEEHWFDWAQLDGLDVESRLSQLCRWVIEADRMYERYGLRLPTRECAVSSGVLHKRKCLESLAFFNSRSVT